MRILDFADGFESNTQPTVEGFDASLVEVVPAGNIASDNVQDALEELDAEKVAKIASTDNRVPRFDGTGGDLQQTGITVDDSNNVTGINDLTVSGDLVVQGNTVTLNTQTLDVEDKNITVAKGGNDAAAEGAGLTVDRTSTKGSLVFDSTKASKFKLGLLGSEAEIVDVSSTQSLAGKTLVLPQTEIITFAEQGSDPSSPSAGNKKVYAKTDGKMYTKDSTGLVKQLGAGAGGGSKNYFGNINGVDNGGDFENNTVGNWVLGTATLTSNLPSGAPTFGSGAHANLSRAINSTTPISGTYDLLYSSSSATTAGNFLASPAVTIDQSDQAKVLVFGVNFRASSNPGNANWSGTSSNSFGIAFYDVTNSTWIIPAGVFSMTQSSGVGRATGTFQTSSNGTQYRMVIFNANATSGAVGINVDDFTLGPQTAPIGPVETDWVAYTPTFNGFGTPSSVDMYWRRVGDTLFVKGTFVSGTSTAAEARVGFPSGATGSTFGAIQNCGNWASSSTGATAYTPLLVESGVTYFTFGVVVGASNFFTKQNGSGITSSGNTVGVLGQAKISGWSSNVTMSNDTDTRVVDFAGSGSGGAITANVTNIPVTTVKDSHGVWTGSTYVVPVAGDYFIGGAFGGPSQATFISYVNGVASNNLGAITTAGLTSAINGFQPNLKPGDILSIRSDTSQTLLVAKINIFRLSGPAVVAASESVFLNASNASGQSIPNNTWTKYTGWTTVDDSHTWFVASTGTYTVNVPGNFTTLGMVGFAANGTGVRGVRVYKNGTPIQEVILPPLSANPQSVPFSIGRRCNPDDTIEIYVYQSSGGSLSMFNSSTYNTLSIVKSGN